MAPHLVQHQFDREALCAFQATSVLDLNQPVPFNIDVESAVTQLDLIDPEALGPPATSSTQQNCNELGTLELFLSHIFSRELCSYILPLNDVFFSASIDCGCKTHRFYTARSLHSGHHAEQHTLGYLDHICHCEIFAKAW